MNSTTSFLKRLQYLFNRHILGRQYLTAYSAPYKTHFKFSIKDGIGKDIYYKWGVYSEDFITQFILNQVGITDSDLIIDIGANIGWYSLVLSSEHHPKILAFEPDPVNFSLLSENIRMNGRQNIEAINRAVADKESVMKLFLYKDYNQGRHSLIEGEKSKGYVEVKTVVLDEFIRQKGLDKVPIKFLKIDIEGFEYTALRGGRETLLRTQNVLSEFSPAIMRKIDESPEAYVNYMSELGFKAYELDESTIRKADFQRMLSNPKDVNDILWKRE